MAKEPKTDSTLEIEITPEMMEAGEYAFAAYDHRFELMEDAVHRVWVAMERVRRRSAGGNEISRMVHKKDDC